MPFVFERKQPINRTQEKQPQVPHRSSLQRLSNIPRPVKQLVVEPSGGISHASKPTLDRLPLQTPQKDLNRTRSIQRDADSTKPGLSDMDQDVELAILELVPFSRQPIVNFGDVKIGATKIKYVLLRNPLDIQQQLFVKSFPKADKGFYMDATEFLIAPNTEICVALAWTPKIVGGLRESITLQDVNRMPKRIVLIGTATRPKPEPSLSKSTRNIPRLFRRSPNKVNRQMIQERNKLVFSPRMAQMKLEKPDKKVKPLTKLLSPSPEKRHQLVRKLLSQYDGQAATKVQSYCRMILEKRRLENLRAALIKVQSYSRMVLERRRYAAQKAAIIKIQSSFRMVLEKRRYETSKRAVIRIQSYYRMILGRRFLKARRAAIVKIQSYCRMILEQRRATAKRAAIIKIQSYFRMILGRRRLAVRKEALIRTQSYCRMVIEKRYLAKRKEALLKLQAYCRMIVAKRRYESQRAAIVKMQSYCRMIHQRRQFVQKRANVIKIQSYVRMFIAKRKYELQKSASLRVQSYWRMVLEKRRFVQLQAARHEAAIVIQKHFRAMSARRELARLKRLNLLTLRFQARSRGLLYRNKLRASIDALQKIQMRFHNKEEYQTLLLL